MIYFMYRSGSRYILTDAKGELKIMTSKIEEVWKWIEKCHVISCLFIDSSIGEKPEKSDSPLNSLKDIKIYEDKRSRTKKGRWRKKRSDVGKKRIKVKPEK